MQKRGGSKCKRVKVPVHQSPPWQSVVRRRDHVEVLFTWSRLCTLSTVCSPLLELATCIQQGHPYQVHLLLCSTHNMLLQPLGSELTCNGAVCPFMSQRSVAGASMTCKEFCAFCTILLMLNTPICRLGCCLWLFHACFGWNTCMILWMCQVCRG